MRRKHQRQDSLELFLDAICNMFGAFLFILLFVVVLLQTTRRELAAERASQTTSSHEFRELQLERDALKQEWREAFEQSNELASAQNRLFDPTIGAVVQKTLQTLQNQQETAQQNAALQAEINARNDKIDAATQDAERVQAELDKKKARLEELEREANERQAAQTRETSPPQLRFSDKPEFPVVLKYGRLYCWKRLVEYGSIFSELEFNDEEFYVVDRDKFGATAAPKPALGIDLNADAQETNDALKKRFAKIKPSRYKIVFVVSADSYSQFNVARNYFKGAGYDIRVLIGAPGERVFDRGGANQEAQ